VTLNLAMMLREAARAHPDKAVALFDGQALSYVELDAASDRIAAGASATEAELVAFVKRRVLSYEYPRSVEVREHLPMDTTGAIRKRELQG
jgi:acyl-CoA synthetase (AMP-forming)/AMP-acid ligase II